MEGYYAGSGGHGNNPRSRSHFGELSPRGLKDRPRRKEQHSSGGLLNDSFQDALLMTEYKVGEDVLDSSFSSDGSPAPSSPCTESHPGVQFYSTSYDAVTAKLATIDERSRMVSSIEITPGFTARLRGAEETWRAIENDFYLPAPCFCCQTDELFCIMDASFVLCPSCKVVSPMEEGSMDGGVGLGFTHAQLRQWQYDVLVSRHRKRA